MTVLWRNYDTKGRNDVVSIPCLVEDNAESLRARYLAWIYDLGETKVKGKRIVDHLEIRPGFSFWWMTLLAQKCTYAASPNIYHAIRLLACEDICGSPNVRKIKVVTPDSELAYEFRSWCIKKKREFEVTLLKPCLSASVNWRVIMNRISEPLVGFCSAFLYYIRRLPLQRQGVTARDAFHEGIMLFDILTHFNKPSANSVTFQSSYWTKLPNLIRNLGLKANWGHFFYKHHATPNTTSAKNVIGELNKNTTEKHFLIDAHFDGKCLFRTLFDFCRLIWKGFPVRKIPVCFPQGSRFSFSHILQNDWGKSLYGKEAASVLWQLNALEAFLCSIPKQRMGIYIQENQPWEIALLHAWRSNGHGKIIGTPHTAIRFWDLRYFYDPRTFENNDKNTLPKPDKVAVNGPAARRAYDTGLGPVDRLIEVEALRFINRGESKVLHEVTNKSFIKLNKKSVLLVATDLLDTNTKIQLEWVAEATTSIQKKWKIVVRPHPASDFSSGIYPRWQRLVERGELAKLLKSVDVIFCSNASSIAVDGYLAGKKILTMLDGNRFNFSPLRGLSKNTYVFSGKQLKASLFKFAVEKANKQSDYFCLSEDLQRWKRLLVIDLKTKKIRNYS